MPFRWLDALHLFRETYTATRNHENATNFSENVSRDFE